MNVECPECQGHGVVEVNFIGIKVPEITTCACCEGGGVISADHAKRLDDGKRRRQGGQT